MPAGFHYLAPAVTAEPGRASEGKNMRATEPEITVFYDGACPRCVRDRAQYERWAGPAGAQVCWFDITGQDERSRARPRSAPGVDRTARAGRAPAPPLRTGCLHRAAGTGSPSETAGLVDRPALDSPGAGAALSLERRAAVAPERTTVTIVFGLATFEHQPSVNGCLSFLGSYPRTVWRRVSPHRIRG